MLQVVSRAVPVAVAILIVGGAAPQGRAEGAGPLTALVDALAERLTIAEPVAAYKWSAHGDQIDATEAIEYRRFADWKLEPAAVPPPPADLAASRAVIDNLNTKILSHISLNWSLLNSPACAGLLHDAQAEVTRRRNLDD